MRNTLAFTKSTGMEVRVTIQDIPIDEGSVPAYLSIPVSGLGRGVLVAHAWWGLNDFIKSFCDRLSSVGFLALAPDLYRGSVADTIEEAQRLLNELDRNKANREMRAAVDYLSQHPAISEEKVGALGFSLGASFALSVARMRPKIVHAVVLFYGTGGGKFAEVMADFQGHFAERDEWGAQASKVQALEQRLLASDGKVEFYTYPETTHWFFEEDRLDAYAPKAAELAWSRTVEFLRSRLS